MDVLKLGEYHFDSNNACLQFNNQTIPLDPRLLALLSFFVANPNRIVSRDELQTAIWRNVIVTDNAINKLVANLRKQFNDDPKAPQYIKTIPKQGYVFIAEINRVNKEQTASEEPLIIATELAQVTVAPNASSMNDNSFDTVEVNTTLATEPKAPTESQAVNTSNSAGQGEPATDLDVKTEQALTTKTVQAKPKKSANAWLLLLVGMFTVLAIWWFAQPNHSVQYGDSRELSRFYGGKGSPILDPSGERLLFLNHRQQGSELWLTEKEGKNYSLPKQITTSMEVNELVNLSGERVLFRTQTPSCLWYFGTLDTSSTLQADATPALDCSTLKVHRSLYLPSQKRLFALGHDVQHEHRNTLFSATLGAELAPLHVEIDKQWRMVSLDSNPHEDSLLITTVSVDGRSALFELNLTTNTVTPLKEFGFVTYHAIWDHDFSGLVLATPAPDSKLIHLNLETDQKTLLASSTERLCCSIVRHPNGVDYVYTSSDKNIDIKWLNAGYSLDNSSVVDSNPAFAHTQNGHYFLSNRAGLTQLYFQAPDKPAERLPLLDDYFMLEHLALSNDDSLLLLAESHRLIMTSLPEASPPKMQFVDGYIEHLHWLTNSLFAVSITDHKSRYVEIYNSNLQRVAKLAAPWRMVVADQHDNRTFYLVDANNTLYRTTLDALLGETIEQNALEKVGELPVFSKLLIENNKLYLVSKFGENLVRYQIEQQQLLPLFEQPLNEYLGFDVENENIIFAGKASYRSQVYKTFAR